MMTTRRVRQRGAILAVVAAFVLIVAGCNRTGGGVMPGQPGTPPGGSTGGGGGSMDHSHPGGGMGQYDHPPTQEQLANLRKLVDQTRAYASAQWPSLAAVTGDKKLHFVGIGDGVHYTSKTCREDKTNGAPKPHIDPTHFGPGYDTLDWTCPESLVMMGGRVAAVMYQLPDKMGFSDIPDMGGNLTMWHSHPLCFGSNNPDDDAYYRIGGALMGNSCSGGYYRGVSPMIHIWLTDSNCGPFRGTSPSDGSCVNIKL
jgi:hypothetical protein